MSALCISQVPVFLASLRPRNTYRKTKDRQGYQNKRSPSIRVSHSLSGFVIVILGALICVFANAEITSTLQSNTPEGGVGSDQRELAAAATLSFAYTGAVQTWCYFTFLCAILKIHFVPFSEWKFQFNIYQSWIITFHHLSSILTFVTIIHI